MKTIRAYGRFALVASTLALAACSHASSGDAATRTGAVQSALSKPTGNVDPTSAKLVLGRSSASTNLQGFGGYFGAVPGLSGLATTTSLPGGVPGGVPGGGTISASCVGGASTSGSVDLSCASNGSASGSITFEVDTSAGSGDASTYVSVTFDNACENGVCIDGTLAVKTAASGGSASVILDADLDVTGGAAAGHDHFGLQTSASAAGSQVDLAIFDDAGKSYVLDTAAAQGSGSVTIKGANGSFTCQYQGGGSAGSCSGSGSFSW